MRPVRWPLQSRVQPKGSRLRRRAPFFLPKCQFLLLPFLRLGPQILTKFCEVQPFGLGLRDLVERSPRRCDPTNLTRPLTCYFLILPSAFFLYSYRLRTNWVGSAVDSRIVSSGLMMILRNFPSGPRRILSSNVAAAVSPWHRIDWPTVVKAG